MSQKKKATPSPQSVPAIAKGETHGKGRTSFNDNYATVRSLQGPERAEALDYFAIELRKHWLDNYSKADVLKAVAHRLRTRGYAERVFGDKQFDEFLRTLYGEGQLKEFTRLLHDHASKLREHYPLRHAVVVADSCGDRFDEIAAGEFLRKIASIGKPKKLAGEELLLGLISGTSVRGVIDCACATKNWYDTFGVNASAFPDIVIFPLNVSFSAPEYLGGNATILAHKLAEKINEQARGKCTASAYGLNAPLMVKASDLRSLDASSPTQQVLKSTAPHRIDPALPEDETKLDIVLTGVGERPPVGPGKTASGSIFYQLASQNLEHLAEQLSTQHVVGDLAFIPLTAEGTVASLKDEAGEEIRFYNAIDLPVFKAMAADKDKAVVLVARSTSAKNKVPAIFAAIGGGANAGTEHCVYVSDLITDETTARGLFTWFVPESKHSHGAGRNSH